MFLLVLMCPLLTTAAPLDQQVCSGSGEPRYAPLGELNVVTWRDGDPVAAIRTPNCFDWASWRSSLVVAVAGRIRAAGGADALLARFAAISSLQGIQYWSVTDQRWQTLITRASALSGPDPEQRRADFSVTELKSGSFLYFSQTDNRSSRRVVYRMRLTQPAADQIVLSIENISGVWLLLVRLFAPGDLHSLYVLEKLSPDLWGYYSLSGVRETALLGNERASVINRANAIYRHVAQIPTDAQPPLAP